MTSSQSMPFIVSPEVKAIHEKIDLLRRVSYVTDGDLNLLLTGESGLGKSEILRRYALKNPRVDESDRTRVPVLYICLQSPKTMKALLAEILIGLGDPQGGASKSTGISLKRLRDLCDVCSVEVIILDEAQTLMQNRSAGVLATIADWIRDLSNELRIPIVLVGMPWCRGFVDSYEQLETRFGYRHHLDDYSVTKGFSRYIDFVSKYLAALDSENSVDVSCKDLMLRLFAYSSGRLRATTGLLNLAHQKSMERNSALCKGLIFDAAKLKRGSGNCFSAPIGEITLREVIKPSEWVNQAGYSRERHIPPEYAYYKVKKGYRLLRQQD